MLNFWSNKIVLITGGAGLLGQEFIKTFKGVGATVVGADSRTSTIDYEIDITDEASVSFLTKRVAHDFGKIDIFINCAAINPQPTEKPVPFEEYPLEEWNKTISVNLTGAFLCCKYIGKQMASQKDKGVIINVASELGLIAPDQSIYNGEYIKPADYGASKAGIINLTKYLASYWRDSIRVNCLVPCGIYNGQSPEFEKRFSKNVPLGRMSKKDEYNEAVLFLASDASSYMTGQCLIIDGGRTVC